MPSDEGVGRVAEEAPVHEPADHGIGGLESGGQGGEDMVAVDGEACPRVEPVVVDEVEERGVFGGEQAVREARLELTQRKHGHPRW
jgi:hypothetical protein